MEDLMVGDVLITNGEMVNYFQNHNVISKERTETPVTIDPGTELTLRSWTHDLWLFKILNGPYTGSILFVSKDGTEDFKVTRVRDEEI